MKLGFDQPVRPGIERFSNHFRSNSVGAASAGVITKSRRPIVLVKKVCILSLAPVRVFSEQVFSKKGNFLYLVGPRVGRPRVLYTKRNYLA